MPKRLTKEEATATETYATIRVLRSTGVEAVTDEQQSKFLNLKP